MSYQTDKALDRIEQWDRENVERIMEDVCTVIGEQMYYVNELTDLMAEATGRDPATEDLTDGVIATDKKGNKIVFTYSTEIQKVGG